MLFSGTASSFGAYAAALPLVHEPGTRFNYSSGTTNIIARIVGDVVARRDATPHERRAAVEGFMRSRLFDPAAMASAIPKFDDAGDFVGSSYVYATARDFARFGELYRCDGVAANGERLLPEGWVQHASERTGHDDESGFDYGRHWWLWPAIPGCYAAHGFEGQFTLVVPALDLVVVHLGKTPSAHNPGLAMRLARIVQSCS
jgi:CubicO group peptidase (beta-lactamase class C family)